MGALVSIVMPALDAERTIAEAVASVAAQSYPDWELLIVADDGRDYAAMIHDAGLSDSRIRFFESAGIARGPAAARSVGQRHATGELVTRLDADDLYERDRLERLAPLALGHGVAGDNAVVFVDGDDKALGALLPPVDRTLAVGALETMTTPVSWCFMFRRDLLPEWDEDLRFAEDVVFNARAFEHLDTVPVLGRPLWRYRVASSSVSHARGANELADATYARLLK